ncbi:hypothetical protein [Paraburkholderia sp. LEh10]|jgi:hypothetical protein|uniref:hypothetical protein n=1 Tax=Paraburkholderia sp. LEh10 TaxID=2821353 RepID=UPI001FD7DFFF|nr:hypothetical protein [Paraburkholderia sp. LEh10]
MQVTEQTLALKTHGAKQHALQAGPRDTLRLWRYAGFALPVVFLAAIEALVRTSVLPMHLVPAPSTILESLWDLGGARVARHIGASVARVYAGFGLGSLLALMIGAAMGLDECVYVNPARIMCAPGSDDAFSHGRLRLPENVPCGATLSKRGQHFVALCDAPAD